MKGLITKMFAVMLVGWYLIGVIGFGVHTCSGSGRSFVVTFAESMDCEEIHPEHSCCCCHEGCCSHHEDEEHEEEHDGSCCSNEYQVLDLTGTLMQEDGRQCHFEYIDCFHGQALAYHMTQSYILPVEFRLIKYIHGPESGHTLPGDVQSILGIWRI